MQAAAGGCCKKCRDEFSGRATVAVLVYIFEACVSTWKFSTACLKRAGSVGMAKLPASYCV